MDKRTFTQEEAKKGRVSYYMHMPVASFKHRVYRNANFAAVGAGAGSLLGGAGGSAFGSALGSGIGGLYGMYKGATYNPDIVDPNTGEKKKLGLLSRAALVSGGGSIGGLGGNLAGGLLGGTLGSLGGGVAGIVTPV